MFPGKHTSAVDDTVDYAPYERGRLLDTVAGRNEISHQITGNTRDKDTQHRYLRIFGKKLHVFMWVETHADRHGSRFFSYERAQSNVGLLHPANPWYTLHLMICES